jgi:hypothetical protein
MLLVDSYEVKYTDAKNFHANAHLMILVPYDGTREKHTPFVGMYNATRKCAKTSNPLFLRRHHMIPSIRHLSPRS